MADKQLFQHQNILLGMGSDLKEMGRGLIGQSGRFSEYLGK